MSNEDEIALTTENLASASGMLKISYRGLEDGISHTAFVAFYDDEGDITDVAKGSILNGVLNVETSLVSGKDISKIRIFTWDNITSITPLLPTITKSIPKN